MSGNTYIPAWDPNAIYQTGDEVTDEGGVYEAAYYVTGQAYDPTNPVNDAGAPSYGPWTVLTPDNPNPAAPDAPTGLASAYTSDTTVALTWNPATVPGIGAVSRYDVYENGVKIGATSQTTFAVDGLTASTAYQFTVDAVDATGTSPQSSAFSVATTAPVQLSGKLFSPYVDMGLSVDENLLAIAEATGNRSFTLAFIQSNGAGSIGWSGTGTIANDGFPDNSSLPDIQQQVQTLQSEGGAITISFGGSAGVDPADVAGVTAAQLQAEYQSVITRYGVSRLDFDIEGAAVADQAGITLRDQALVGLEAVNPGLQVSFTLPVLPTGLDGNGVNVIDNAVKDGVKVNVVNIMAMDYGSPSVDDNGAMGQDAIAAAQATEAQIQAAGLGAKVGVTPMIGMNDDTSEIFSLADAQQLETFAADTSWVAGIGMWSIGRDNGGGAGDAYTSATNSSIQETPYEFSSIFFPVDFGAAQSSVKRAADFNGDGRSDILFENANGALAMWEMNGAGVTGGGVFQNLGATYSVAGIGDFSGDGNADVLLSTAAGALALWDLNGPQVIGGGPVGQLGTGWSLGPTGDFNGDGKADVLFLNANGGVGMWEMNNTQVVGGGTIAALGTGSGWSLAGTGDFNGDGKSDILLANANSQIAIWQMNGAAVTGGGVIGSLGANSGWNVAGVGDFNGDGKSDILFENANGALAMWEMNGVNVIGGGIFQSLGANSGWSVAAVGDYNGDGLSDILLHNTSGATQIWEMNGTQVIGGGPTPAIPAPWSVIHS